MEQANWTIQGKAITALIDAGLPNTLWAEADIQAPERFIVSELIVLLQGAEDVYIG